MERNFAIDSTIFVFWFSDLNQNQIEQMKVRFESKSIKEFKNETFMQKNQILSEWSIDLNGLIQKKHFGITILSKKNEKTKFDCIVWRWKLVWTFCLNFASKCIKIFRFYLHRIHLPFRIFSQFIGQNIVFLQYFYLFIQKNINHYLKCQSFFKFVQFCKKKKFSIF